MVTLSTTKPPAASAFYKVGQFGIETRSIREDHGVYYYPTANDRQEAGIFSLGMPYSGVGDFNGDGRQDIILGWVAFPHTVPRQSMVAPSLYLNDGKGGLRLATSAEADAIPAIFKGQRFAVADLNGDGVDDIVQASEGMNQRNTDGTYTTKYDPIILMLSAPGGRIMNATTNIQGQEALAPPAGYAVGHEISVGDVDGDGDKDLFSGKLLFLNDGKGKFTAATGALPEAVKPGHTILTASAIGDVDGDGKADIFAAYIDGTQVLALSRWNGQASGWQLQTIPQGLYGANTKPNDAEMADVNGDGKLDIIVTQTRSEPYYRGAGVQILINKGSGQFVDETASRIDNGPRDKWWGEGEIYLADFDGDGDIDLSHSTDHETQDGKVVGGGAAIALNDGTGKFTWLAQTVYADVKPYQLAGYEDTEPFQQRPLPARLFPIDLDGKGAIDFVAQVQTPFSKWPTTEPAAYTTYTVINTAPLPGSADPTILAATRAMLRGSNSALATDLSAKVSAGALTQAAAIAEIVKAADQTTSVATLSYLFFTGKIPSVGGIDYLVSASGPNPNNLNSAYFQSFNLENRYINFAVNLGRDGEGKAAFQTEFGSLSLFDATKKAYAEIFGGTPTDAKVTALLSGGRDAYFASYGGDGLTGQGTKAAMVGWLLAEAEKGDLGVMARSNAAWLTDLADGSAPFAIDITAPGAGYYKSEFVFGG
ncbi:FG-GAP-like repeat-containing protein [Caulobacter segnis]|uniref:FG-GAP-like repeat-containing protein n=1 Tax=Caulobacter segnis TaxID=88688 RepID=UPI00240F21E1|nr:FG-GAP-like repeat-containing protein [Caulobacter segnis]MDG2521181.1 FG-GAP-like repeat-containing protein [Caulobacter segnis]